MTMPSALQKMVGRASLLSIIDRAERAACGEHRSSHDCGISCVGNIRVWCRLPSIIDSAPWLIIICLLLVLPSLAFAEEISFTNLLAQGEAIGLKGDVPGALKIYATADALASTNSVQLCTLTQHYCDLMYDTTAPDLQKTLAQTAFDCAQRALKADTNNALAHLCIAVGYVKNFPYADSETKMKWSRAIKTECEIAIKLDPKQDVSYYLLGRWNYNIANLNFFYKGMAKLIYGGFPPASVADAIANFKKAIELAPNRIIHRQQLAIAYVSTGQKALAVAELEKCATLQPIDRDDVQAKKDAATLLASLQ